MFKEEEEGACLDPRIKVLWRKSRKLRIGLVLAGLLCLGIFLVLNFSLRDSNGPFPWQDQPYHVQIPLDRNQLSELEVQAENVRLEVGMVNNINKIQVSLSGSGYSNQDVSVDVRDEICQVAYAPAPGDSPENLSLRILIPQNDLKNVEIISSTADLHLAGIRADRVQVVNPQGQSLLENINSHLLQVETLDAPTTIQDSFVTQLVFQGQSAPLSLRENTFRKVQAQNASGPIFVFGDSWRGQWELATETGDITTLTRRLPYSLLIQAQSLDGKAEIGYRARYWKDVRSQEDDQTYYGGVGNNPANSLTLLSAAGDIHVDQRQRDSDTNPYPIQ